MPHPDLPGTKISLFYETNHLKWGASDTEKFRISLVYDEISYMARTYFDDPNYFTIDGRPVVYFYVTRVLQREGLLDDLVREVKRAAFDNGGHDVYIVGDNAFNYAREQDKEAFDLLDAVTNYDMYGSLGRPRYVRESGINRYKASQNSWREATKAHGGCDFIPALGPGYNDRGVREGNAAMSRSIIPGAPEGSLFSTLLPLAFDMADEDTGGVVMINSFNEWHEDSQIEPVGDVGSTSEPSELTQDLEYPAYGTLYLDILRNATIAFDNKGKTV